MWLVPPTMNSQMTFFAFGAKCGVPSGGDQPDAASARATPSRWSNAPRTSPVNPIPTSARNVRRLAVMNGPSIRDGGRSSYGQEIIMVEQDVDQVGPDP